MELFQTSGKTITLACINSSVTRKKSWNGIISNGTANYLFFFYDENVAKRTANLAVQDLLPDKDESFTTKTESRNIWEKYLVRLSFTLQRGLRRATLPNEIDDRTKKYFLRRSKITTSKKEHSWIFEHKRNSNFGENKDPKLLITQKLSRSV